MAEVSGRAANRRWSIGEVKRGGVETFTNILDEPDISELFNYIDDKGGNKITKQQFMSAVSFILQKVSGPSSADAALSRGVRTTQRGVSNQQLIFAIMKKVCDGIQT